MFVLVWTILSIAFFLYFFYLCFKTIGLVRREFGLGPALVLVIGLLSLAGKKPEEASQPAKKFAVWKFNSDSLVNLQPAKRKIIDKNLVFKINLYCTYGFSKTTNQLLPVSASCNVTGVRSGVKWVPENVFITADSSGTKIEFYVSGTLEWQLLNSTIRYEYKNYEGTIDADPIK